MTPLAARALVFFTSASVLVLEILAGRLLAPFLGVTLETFTGIIGTVLAGIALGNWLGGRAADRFDPHRLLGPALIAGGVFAVAAAPIVAATGPSMRAAGPIEIVLLTTLAFFVPAVVLSTVTPIVVKIQLHDLAETGSVVGQFSAIATAGAIFGTFATGFLLIATLPTRPILWVVGGALVAAGLVLWSRAGRHPQGVLPLVVLALPAAGLLQLVDEPCDMQTAYFCTRVTEDPNRESGRVLWLDTLRHSYVDLEDPTYLGFRYARLMADVFATKLPDGPVDALYIGGGGFTLPRWMTATHPGGRQVVLELDPSLVDLAERDLGLVLDDSITALVGDARITLAQTPEASFDLVVGDAFGGPSVPWHLTTEEFLIDVERRLRPGGLYILNLLDYPPLGFARAETATIAAVFDHVLVLAPADYIEQRRGGNFVVAGSNEPFDSAAIEALAAARGEEAVALTGEAAAAFMGGAQVLRDDFAPVDQLITTP